MHILGISAFYHDSAAALVRDGEIVAAAQEERFTRKKHDHDFPRQAAAYCVREAGIEASDLDLVVFYDKPLLKFDRLLETYLGYAPRGFKLFLMGLPLWIKQKLHIPRELDRGLDGQYRGRYVFTEHHESHAASAFYPSPFDEAAILTLDGVGEWATGSIGRGAGNRIELLQEMRFPHSLGLLYSAFTYFAGFKVNSGEYKLMGLAPYGEPVYRERILDELLDLKPDGSFRMNMDYFAYGRDDVMTATRMEALFDGPPRRPETAIGQREMDLAASIQAVTEEVVLRIGRHAHALTGCKHLTMAGGVALNCVANGRLLREGPFERIWIQPAAGDAGGALGAALFAWHQLYDKPRTPRPGDAQRGSLLGPAYDDREVRAFLDGAGAHYTHFDDEAALCDAIAALVADGQVVGHMAGRMEFGPRALGARSILGDPRSPEMQSVMNRKIKFRESFRPFAPAVLREDVAAYFETRPGEDSPYMLLVAPVRDARPAPQEGSEHEGSEHEASEREASEHNASVRAASEGQATTDKTSEGTARGFDKLKQVRSGLPAVTHVDGSARIQTLDPERHPRFHAIVQVFKRRTGCPVMINTSFNVRGEPIVMTPGDAYRCFMGTDMDALVIERCLLRKADQPHAARVDREAYLGAFTLD